MRIADVLPLTPLQRGLLFHASTSQGSDDDVYAVQLDITLTGRLDQHRLRDAVHAVASRHPHVVARFSEKFDEPVQIIPADPEVPWRYIELDADSVGIDEQIQRSVRRRARRGVRPGQPVGFSGSVDPRPAKDRHRFVLTNHHIVMDGWSLPILLQEVFAGYYGQRLPPAGPLSQICHLAGRPGPRRREYGLARGAGRFRRPHLGGPARPVRAGTREVSHRFECLSRPPAPSGELARSCHTQPSAWCCRPPTRSCCAS